ncbi:hypothetical protein ACJJTC_019342 [Scirpophaga incertulas]
MQRKKLKEVETWRKLAEYYFRSVTFGAMVPFTFVTINCIFRNIFGLKNSYFTSLVLPFSLNALAVYLEPPHRRGLVVNLFVNLVIEYWMKCLSRSGYLEITRSKQTLLFMIGNALLFYLMRLEGDREKRTPLFWLYTAEKVKRKTDDSENVCPHKGPCQKHVLKGYSTYFAIGLGLSLTKLILPRIRTPLKAISQIRGKHFKMALFFGSYIGIYRAVICFLCRRKGFDSALYALPAGYLAGLSMLFSPSTGLSIAAVTAAMKLYSTILYEKNVLPKEVPIPELLYCLSQGILFSARYVDSSSCPSYIWNLMDTVSYGHCEQMRHRILEHAKKIPAL